MCLLNRSSYIINVDITETCAPYRYHLCVENDLCPSGKVRLLLNNLKIS